MIRHLSPLSLALGLLISAAAAAQGPGWRSEPLRSKEAPAPHVVIHVDGTALGAADGTSWQDAFTDLQAALARARTGDEIWVAAGTYTPSDTDAALSFVLEDDVALYGGFSGSEASRAERDWVANETILSGDIARDDVVDPWPSGWNIGTSNSGHVLVGSGVGRGALVDGFTVANGHTGPAGTGAGDELMFGSGIYIVGGSPTLRNCRFTHNLAAFAAGGGLYCLDGNPLIEACEFEQNYAHSGNGGAMFFYGASQPEVRDCLFLGNVSVAGSISAGDGNGGAVAVWSELPVTVERCLFDGNSARSFWSVGDSLGYGGGLWVWNGGLTVRECVFTDNDAHYGGGLMAWGPAQVINCLFQDNTANVLPNDPYPEQGGEGAGIMLTSFAPATAEVLHSTVAYNHGKKHVGLASSGAGGHLDVRNSIVTGNAGTSPEVLGYWTEQIEGSFDLAYCCVPTIFDPPAPGEDPIEPENLPGCIDAVPLFVLPDPYGDLHLAAGSPCIDAADNLAVPADVLLDLDGQPRFVDDPGTSDTGNGTAPIADMGAYEAPAGQPLILAPRGSGGRRVAGPAPPHRSAGPR